MVAQHQTLTTLTRFQAYRNKITNKLWGTAHVPAQGVKKGDVLLSYMTGPFTQAPGEHFSDPHSGYWECREIARLFQERGYAVDIVDAKNAAFLSQKPYVACVDILQNLESLSPRLESSCKKVLHVVCSYPEFQNSAERKRLNELEHRRGIALAPVRTEPVSRNAAYADLIEGFGNNAVHATYALFNKPITPIPISTAKMYDFPKDKSFAQAKKEFLWFGGGGAVLKGLDLLLETFAGLPEYRLHIIGPAAYEEDFARAYERELSLPNIRRYPRPKMTETGDLLVAGEPLADIANRCAALIYPSASEGTSGAVVQAMHLGLIPLVSPQTGLYEDAPAVLLPADPTIGDLAAAAHAIAAAAPEELVARAHAAWSYARGRYTRTTFSTAYARFIDETLKL